MAQGFINTSGVVPTQGTWTPVPTLSSPGDLSVAYLTQTGSYFKVGNSVSININLTFTPTYTTASGIFYITGIPYTPVENAIGALTNILALTYPTGRTQLYAAILPDTTIRIWGMGSAVTQGQIEVGQIPTGVQQSFIISATYLTS